MNHDIKNFMPGDEVVSLDTPDQCREFIKSLRISNGKEESRITFFQLMDGTQVDIDDATDVQIVDLAIELTKILNKQNAH